MSKPIQTVVGIDIGGLVKGFHAVVLRDKAFEYKKTSTDPALIAAWCHDHAATVVAVDSPCGWSHSPNGSSRQAEREMKINGKQLYCFSTPTLKRAQNNMKGFYNWVFNGQRLYRELVNYYPLFKGLQEKGAACIETFPHAVASAISGQVLSAKHKVQERRKVLRDEGYDISILSNIDFVDAALCAIAAESFRKGNESYQCFGNPEEGFIVVPDCYSE